MVITDKYHIYNDNEMMAIKIYSDPKVFPPPPEAAGGKGSIIMVTLTPGHIQGQKGVSLLPLPKAEGERTNNFIQINIIA
jgi:hypothetical protein